MAWLGQVAALELHVPQWRIEQPAGPTVTSRSELIDFRERPLSAAWSDASSDSGVRPVTRIGTGRLPLHGQPAGNPDLTAEVIVPPPAPRTETSLRVVLRQAPALRGLGSTDQPFRRGAWSGTSRVWAPRRTLVAKYPAFAADR